MSKKTISVSEIQTYESCPTKHQYIYVERLAKPSDDNGPMRLGTVYHEIMSHVLQAMYHGNTPEKNISQLIDWTAKVWDQAKRPVKFLEFGDVRIPDTEFYESWDDTLDRAKILARLTVQQLDLLNRFEVLDTNLLDIEYRPSGDPLPLVEYKFSFPVEGTNYMFNGVVDAVVKDKDSGHLVVLDWKTKSTFIDEDDEKMNMQVGLYQYVLREMGINVSRGLIYQIKSGIIRPRLNQPNKKTGIADMSRRVVTTTWEIYREMLVKNNLDPQHYEDMREKLTEVERDLFRPLSVYRSPAFLKNLWTQLKVHLSHITEDTGDRVMALGFSCYSCPFKVLCNFKLEGWPIESIIKENFIHLPDREAVVSEE